ncbi:MAG: hypothetical protein J0H07_14215 [Sphingobacteriales bacterium]|nr:hypothetical protein [Sphingobacteriales bacterium]
MTALLYLSWFGHPSRSCIPMLPAGYAILRISSYYVLHLRAARTLTNDCLPPAIPRSKLLGRLQANLKVSRRSVRSYMQLVPIHKGHTQAAFPALPVLSACSGAASCTSLSGGI